MALPAFAAAPYFCLIHALPDRLFPARRCWWPAHRGMPVAAVHAVAARAVFQPRRRAGFCADGLAHHAAAPRDPARRTLGCVEPGGSRVAAAGGVLYADPAAGRRLGMGLAAVAGIVWPRAGGGVGADWLVDRLCRDVGGAGAVNPGRCDCPAVRAHPAAVSPHHPAGGRYRPVAAGRAGVAAGGDDRAGPFAGQRNEVAPLSRLWRLPPRGTTALLRGGHCLPSLVGAAPVSAAAHDARQKIYDNKISVKLTPGSYT